MIHQLEGILLIRIECNNVGYSYETKSKTFVVGDDFCWIETSTKRRKLLLQSQYKTESVNKPASQVRLMNRSKTTR